MPSNINADHHHAEHHFRFRFFSGAAGERVVVQYRPGVTRTRASIIERGGYKRGEDKDKHGKNTPHTPVAGAGKGEDGRGAGSTVSAITVIWTGLYRRYLVQFI